MEILEYGKIMQLVGLSESQLNGCIVSIDGLLEENGEISYLCDVILGENNKGKKLKVKEINITEVPPLPPDQLKVANEKFSKLFSEFDDVKRADSLNTERINKLIDETNELIEVVPNCCVLWQLLACHGKFLCLIPMAVIMKYLPLSSV